MKQWYLFYSDHTEKLAQLARELQRQENQPNKKLQQLVGELQTNEYQQTTKRQQLVGELRHDQE